MPRTGAINRSSPEAAREVIESIFEGAPSAAKQAFIEFLAAAIERLAQQDRDNWGVTLFGWGLRLNAGMVECLVLSREGIRVLVEERSAPAAIKLDGRRYPRAPGCDMTTVPLAEIPDAAKLLAESHAAAMSMAARSHAMRNIRGAHSAGVTAFLSQALRRVVPNPTYASSIEATLLLQFDQEEAHGLYSEGGQATVMVNRFERDHHAREECISHHGLRCSVCHMSFGERYGETVKGFIHVHHLVPLAEIGTEYQVDPVTDLRPVCPNCHAVIHRNDPPLSIEQARALLLR
jgi:5-methylcytosine-specific restriction protein A